MIRRAIIAMLVLMAGLAHGAASDWQIVQVNTSTAAINLPLNLYGVPMLASNNTFAGGTTQAFDGVTVTNLTMQGGNIALGSGWLSGDGDNEGVSVSSAGDVTMGHSLNASWFLYMPCVGSAANARSIMRGWKYGGVGTVAPASSIVFSFLGGVYDGYSVLESAGFEFYCEGTVSSNNAAQGWRISTGTSGRTERLRVTSGGDLCLQNTTGTNILSVKQSSTTDPIADSWLTYTCTRDEKTEVEPELNTGYLGRLAAWKTYRYQRLPIVRDNEVELVTAGIMSAREEVAAEQTAKLRSYEPDKAKREAILIEPKPITSKEEDDIRVSLSAVKAAAPKFNAVKVGPMIDDPETPREIFADGQNYSSGIDMLAYIGFLHAALREEVQAREALEKRLAKLEEIVKP